jgi:hypothetical protein
LRESPQLLLGSSSNSTEEANPILIVVYSSGSIVSDPQQQCPLPGRHKSFSFSLVFIKLVLCRWGLRGFLGRIQS